MKPLINIALLLLSIATNAQKERLYKTTIIDAFGTPIAKATGVVMLSTDSSYVSNSISNEKGNINFSLPLNSYYIIFSAASYTTKIYQIDSSKTLPDTIYLEKNNTASEAVTIYASPVVVKEDTIQFNNELFKKDSIKSLEEVLKKIPGVTIDREGSIEVNGIRVQELLLEGKPLPTNDIKQLIQTLEAGLIDKIQFIDRKTEETRITKIDNGQRDKVINIKLKGKIKKSLTQDYVIGYGNSNRVEAKALANYIYNDWYSNANVTYNNTGRNNYSNINFYNPNGISKGLSINAGLRYIGNKKWVVGGTLTFSNQTTLLDEHRDRVIFLKDSLNYYAQDLSNKTKNNSFSFNNNITFTPDSLSEWKCTLNGNTAKAYNDRQELFTTLNNSKLNINEGSRVNNGDATRASINLSLSGGRRTRNNKFSVYTNLNFNLNNSDDLTFQFNDIIFFRSSGIGFDTTQQKINTLNKSTNFRGSITTYTKLYAALRLSLGGGINYGLRPTFRNALLYDYTTKLYTTPNTVLLNDVLNTTNISTQSVGLLYSYKKHNFSATLNFNQQLNRNDDYYRDTILLQNNRFTTPNVNYSFNNSKITISQSASVSQRTPTTQQLQPIIDNSNPLFIRKGNPDLKNEQTFNINTSLNKKNSQSNNKVKKGLTFNFSNNLIFTKNRIANNTFFDVNEGKQVSVPINLPDVFSNNTNFSINQYFDKSKFNINGRMAINYSKDNNFLNGELNKLTNISIRPAIGIKVNKKKYYIDYAIGYLYQTNTYSLRPNQNIKLGNFTTDATAALLFIKNWEFNLDYQQTVNTNKRSIQRINNLNARIAYTPKLKKPKFIIAFQAFDLLNQNSNLRQNINDYYEEFIYTNAIRRFFLVSVQVKLNKFKAS